MANILILFSGTKSFSKVLKNFQEIKEIRTLDLDPKFNPTYNVNILEWNYKKDLENYKVDYIHSSPVCCEFSQLKNVNKNRNLELGFSLVDKTIEIINWIKENNNPKLFYTIENPKTSFILNYEPLKQFKVIITSYCRYGYLYKKDTCFFYGGFNLKLRKKCCKNFLCFSKSINNNIHKVRIGLTHSKDTGTYKRSNKGQIGDIKYFKYLRKNEKYKGVSMTDTYFRYRIPPKLIEHIWFSIINFCKDCEEVFDGDYCDCLEIDEKNVETIIEEM